MMSASWKRGFLRRRSRIGLPLEIPLGGRVTVSERQILGQILEQD